MFVLTTAYSFVLSSNLCIIILKDNSDTLCIVMVSINIGDM